MRELRQTLPAGEFAIQVNWETSQLSSAGEEAITSFRPSTPAIDLIYR